MKTAERLAKSSLQVNSFLPIVSLYKSLSPRLGNVALRAFALFSRFILVIALARIFDPEQLGIFGLFSATIFFSLLFIGGDFYTYSQRELLSRQPSEWTFVIQHQGIGTIFLYIILLPIQLIYFAFDLLPFQWALWFFLILIPEHLAQEINRLLVAMHQPILASWVMFIRIGLWVWPLLAVLWYFPATQSLESVFIAWLSGALFALLLGFVLIWKEISPWRWWPINLNWILHGYRVGFLFLIATLSFRALQTVDRYLVEIFAGPELLGVYVLYSGIVMAVLGFLDPAVFSFLYPRLVKAYRQGDMAEYHRAFNEMAWSALILSLLLSCAVAFFTPILFAFTDKPIYQEYDHLLWILLPVVILYAIGMIPHYALYARGSDSIIIAAHVTSFLTFLVTVVLIAPLFPLEAPAIGLMTAFTWMGLMKYWYLRRLSRAEIAKIPA